MVVDKTKNKKNDLLGMNHGTATHRLRKMILFSLLKELNKDECFQCKNKIETVEELSLEHKIPWMNSNDPKGLFWSLDNISFSHLKCNIGAAIQPNKGIIKHPSQESYKRGCRCEECTEIQKLRQRDFRSKL